MKLRNVRSCCLAAALWMAQIMACPESARAAAEGEPWGIWLGFGRLFNLLLVAAVLVLLLRKPLANFFARRSEAIRQQLAEAQKARAEAEAKLAEIQSRMSRLDGELQEIAGNSEKEAREEYRRLVAEAERDADKIVGRSRLEIEAMTRTAEQKLKLHAAELAVRLAEEKIRGEISAADQERLLRRFVEKLGGNA